MTRFIAIVLWLGLATAGQGQERPDLVPGPARWWTYPAEVRRVVIDPTGRPWCELAGPASIAALKTQVESATSLRAPWVAGARVLLIDRDQRVWLLPQADDQLLLGYDPKQRRWIERRVLPPAERGGYDDRQPNVTRYIFTGPAYQSRSGRLYFADRLGVHVFQDQTWSYQPLYQANLEQDIFHGETRSFNPPHFAEDDQGRVYVWSRWGQFGWSGTIGYFVHDGQQWRAVRNGDARADRWEAVLPLAGGRLLLCSDSGPVRLVAGEVNTNALQQSVAAGINQLGHSDYAQRQAAQQRLAELGPAVLPGLRAALTGQRDPEVTVRLRELIERLEEEQTNGTAFAGHTIQQARFLGRDRQGGVLLWADRVVGPDAGEVRGGFWWINPAGQLSRGSAAMRWTPDSMLVDRRDRVWFACYEQGCAIVSGDQPVAVTTPQQSSYRYLLGEDANGRVYLSDDKSVAVVRGE